MEDDWECRPLPESVHTVDGQPVILDPHLTVHQGELDNGVEGDLQVG